MARHISVDFRARDYWHPRFWPMWIYFGILRAIALLPYPGQVSLGKILGKILKSLSPSRQRIVDINLQLCFPEKSVAERNKIKNASFQNLGVALLEMSMCWWWSEDRLRSLVEIRGREHIEAVLDSGRGVVEFCPISWPGFTG